MTKGKESLICELCSKNWFREMSRGRKPKHCPECVKENVVEPKDEIIVVKKNESKSRTATKWICPSCNESVTVFINLIYPPICRNPNVHSTKSIDMEKSTTIRQKEKGGISA